MCGVYMPSFFTLIDQLSTKFKLPHFFEAIVSKMLFEENNFIPSWNSAGSFEKNGLCLCPLFWNSEYIAIIFTKLLFIFYGNLFTILQLKQCDKGKVEKKRFGLILYADLFKVKSQSFVLIDNAKPQRKRNVHEELYGIRMATGPAISI